MIAKQVILSLVLLFGGAVTIFAVVQNGKSSKSDDVPEQVVTTAQVPARPVAVPLTADVETEEKILSQKQKQRELYNQQLAKEADALLSEQEHARMLALDKAKQETSPTTQSQISADNASKSEMIAMPAVQTRPEAVEAARVTEQKRVAEQKAAQERQLAEQKSKEVANKETNHTKQDKQAEKSTTQIKTESKPATSNDTSNKGRHTITKGDTLIGLSRTYGVPVSVLAAANDMNRHDALLLGRIITIPSSSSIDKIKQDAQQTRRSAQNNASTVKSEAKSEQKANNTAVAYNYSVQVAISPDKAKVDEVVKKYRAAGYQVSTSQTSRGIRVLIGSADSYDEANAIRQKLAEDSRVDASGAWVKKLEK